MGTLGWLLLVGYLKAVTSVPAVIAEQLARITALVEAVFNWGRLCVPPTYPTYFVKKNIFLLIYFKTLCSDLKNNDNIAYIVIKL